MTRRSRAACAIAWVLAAFQVPAGECARLSTQTVADVRIERAESVPAGKLTAPEGVELDVPAFCRVQGVATPSERSNIGFELWLPDAGWNGRYYQLGNGGFAGNIHLPALAAELRRGNAVAASDTGHRASAFDGSWALNEPDRIIDYGYRSIDATSRAAQALVRAYYGRDARYRYFAGCSNGGRQAFMAAQRYPEAWDGILAGAPAWHWTSQLTTFAAAPTGDVEKQRTFAEQFFRYFVHDNPAWTLDRFDAKRDPELARSRRIGAASLSQVLDAADTDLSRFDERGGKLLMYFGTADDLISPHEGIDYYERAHARHARTASFFRLFLVPGMGHCQGGGSPHAFGQSFASPGLRDDPEHDARRALEAWVELGRVPERLVEAAQVLTPYRPGAR